MLPVEILPVQETIVLRARGSELLILPHHVKQLKGFTKPKDFSHYFRAEALVNRPARKLFEAWLRKDHTLWPRLYQTVHKEMDIKEGDDGEAADEPKAKKAVKEKAADEAPKAKAKEKADEKPAKVEKAAAKEKEKEPKAKAETKAAPKAKAEAKTEKAAPAKAKAKAEKSAPAKDKGEKGDKAAAKDKDKAKAKPAAKKTTSKKG